MLMNVQNYKKKVRKKMNKCFKCNQHNDRHLWGCTENLYAYTLNELHEWYIKGEITHDEYLELFMSIIENEE